MMEASDFGDRDNRAEPGRFDWPAVGGVLVEREMSAGLVIVAEVAGQDSAQVAFIEDQNVIQTLAPNRAEESLREGILPGALRRHEDFLDPQAVDSVPKLRPVDLVTISQKIGGRGVVRERVHDLDTRTRADRRRVLTHYFTYYHRARTHLALEKDAPGVRPTEPPKLGTVARAWVAVNRVRRGFGEGHLQGAL